MENLVQGHLVQENITGTKCGQNSRPESKPTLVPKPGALYNMVSLRFPSSDFPSRRTHQSNGFNKKCAGPKSETVSGTTSLPTVRLRRIGSFK